MKIVVLGFTFGVIAVTLIGAVQARDDGRYTLSPLKPWFDSLKSGKGPCCSDADGFAVQIRIGNRRTVITWSASITNGSRFPMMP